nr:retrotransposon protein, putative, Ty1-copia subclass [Tanacetum cinerariifolium]
MDIFHVTSPSPLVRAYAFETWQVMVGTPRLPIFFPELSIKCLNLLVITTRGLDDLISLFRRPPSRKVNPFDDVIVPLLLQRLDVVIMNHDGLFTKRAKHNLDSTYLWHRRLVHISKKRIEKLQQEGLLKSTDDESFDQCVSYSSVKMTRKSFPHRPERATDLLGIIHTDVYGPLRHVSRQESTTRILNMVPTKKVDKTPYELWKGCKGQGGGFSQVGARKVFDQAVGATNVSGQVAGVRKVSDAGARKVSGQVVGSRKVSGQAVGATNVSSEDAGARKVSGQVVGSRKVSGQAVDARKALSQPSAA